MAIRPRPAHPFPWTWWTFLDAFPESVLLEAPDLDEAGFPQQDYDLIILGWTAWYLPPSLPVTAFLKSAAASPLAINGRPPRRGRRTRDRG